MSTDEFLKYQLLQLCQNAIETCPFTNPVAGADCTKKFCTGFPAYIDVGTCVTLNEDPDNCCTSDDPQSCLENYAHGSSGSGTGGSSTPNVCASVISILDSCFSATPALSPSGVVSTSGPSATALADCACYDSSGQYAPGMDTYASECAASGSAAHPTYFPLVTPLVNFCTDNAAVAAATTTPAAAAASTTVAGAAVTSTPASEASSTPAVASSTKSAASVASSNSAAAGTTAATSAGSGSGSGSSSTSAGTVAQTTSSKSSGGFKITVRGSVVVLLGLSMLLNF